MRKFILSFLTGLGLISQGHALYTHNPNCFTPWVTGPLLAPSARTMPKGDVNFEPYLFAGRNIGRYDSHWDRRSTTEGTAASLQVPLQIGVTDNMQVFLNPTVYYNVFESAHAYRFGDLAVGVAFQLATDEPGTWMPDILLQFTETFPTGKYQKLNPKKRGTDGVGGGSFATQIMIATQKWFYYANCHCLRARFSASYTYAAPTHVKDFNSYGGGMGAHGKVYPGSVVSSIIGLEYPLNQRWVLALDIMGTGRTRTRFKGFPGMVDPFATIGQTIATVGSSVGTSNGILLLSQQTSPILTTVGSPSSMQFSLAPAIEYNLSSTIGWIGGVWFSVAGMNTSQFVTGVIAYNQVF